MAGCGVKVIWASWKEEYSLLFLSSEWSAYEIGNFCYLKVWWSSPIKPSRLDICVCVRRFWNYWINFFHGNRTMEIFFYLSQYLWAIIFLRNVEIHLHKIIAHRILVFLKPLGHLLSCCLLYFWCYFFISFLNGQSCQIIAYLI